MRESNPPSHIVNAFKGICYPLDRQNWLRDYILTLLFMRPLFILTIHLSVYELPTRPVSISMSCRAVRARYAQEFCYIPEVEKGEVVPFETFERLSVFRLFHHTIVCDVFNRAK